MRFTARMLKKEVCDLYGEDVWVVERVSDRLADPVHVATFRDLSVAVRLLHVLDLSIEHERYMAMLAADHTPASEFENESRDATSMGAEGGKQESVGPVSGNGTGDDV